MATVLHEKIDELLSKHVISYLTKIEGKGYLLAIVPISEYGKDDSQQIHFEGNSIDEAIDSAISSCVSDCT